MSERIIEEQSESFKSPSQNDILTNMTSIAYELGVTAGQKGLWFHETMEDCLARRLFAPENRIDFYRGYWRDLFDVTFKNGSYVMKNRYQ